MSLRHIVALQSIWALLGQGDVYTWLHRTDDAVRSYERALVLDPLFDIAHLRLITLYTGQARKLMTAKLGQHARISRSVQTDPLARFDHTMLFDFIYSQRCK